MSNVPPCLSFIVSEAVNQYVQCYPLALNALRDLAYDTEKVMLKTWMQKSQSLQLNLDKYNGYLKQIAVMQISIRKAKDSCPSEKKPIDDYKYQEELGYNLSYFKASEEQAIAMRKRLSILDSRVTALMSRFIGRIRLASVAFDRFSMPIENRKQVDSELYFWASRHEESHWREGRENVFPFFHSFGTSVRFKDLEPTNEQESVRKTRAKSETEILTTLNDDIVKLSQEIPCTNFEKLGETFICPEPKGPLAVSIQNVIELYEVYPQVSRDLMNLQVARDEWFLQRMEFAAGAFEGIDVEQFLHLQLDRFLKYEASSQVISCLHTILDDTINRMPKKRMTESFCEQQASVGYDLKYLLQSENILFQMKDIFEPLLLQVSAMNDRFPISIKEAKHELKWLVFNLVKIDWLDVFLEERRKSKVQRKDLDDKKNEPVKKPNPKEIFEDLERLNKRLMNLPKNDPYEKFERIMLLS